MAHYLAGKAVVLVTLGMSGLGRRHDVMNGGGGLTS